ncbi:esterase [Naegleria gruberi]|uniref:Esterase n=1 Tax=Naegleria gruberi TaxID=5762 RepID=D2VVE7_NAEGR|nr:esterase [Naegleria gruberi]EFC39221.1 esterase [Naegleria gruberi]|eukprot:XP_002671965.1 esterase [Naegleria gruberi]
MSLLFYIPIGILSGMALWSLYLRIFKKLSLPAQITRLVFHSFRLQMKYWKGAKTMREGDSSLKNLSEEELSLMNMMDTLIGKFDSEENKNLYVDNDFMDKNKKREEIIDEIIKFRTSLPGGIHQSKAGPFYLPDEKIFLRETFELPNKHPSIYFNFHDKLEESKRNSICNKFGRVALIHFHGGGYLMGEPSTCYTLENICSTNGFDLFGVDYSLYPEHTIEDAIEDAFKAFKWLVDEKGAKHVISIGESAGGHLATMLVDRIAQERQQNGLDDKYNCIVGVIGLSPWCDVTMTSPGMCDAKHVDRALPNKALNQFKKWGIPLGFNQLERGKNLSPNYFSKDRIDRMKDITNRFLFSYSRNERLTLEIDKFISILNKNNFSVEKHVETIPFHCFHIFCDFIPAIFSKLESQIVSFIEKGVQQSQK